MDLQDQAPVAPTSRAEYRPDEPFDVQLRGIDDAALFNADNTPMTISVIGADSDVAVKARNAQSNRRLSAGPRAKLTAEGLDSDGASYLAKLSTGWNITPSLMLPGVDFGFAEAQPAFSTEAALSLYRNRYASFIREQVDAAIAERANFLKRSQAN